MWNEKRKRVGQDVRVGKKKKWEIYMGDFMNK